MADESKVFGAGRRPMTGATPAKAKAALGPNEAYGTLADAVRNAASHEGSGTFTVQNQNDKHELLRLLSGQKHRRAVVIDQNQKERVSWKASEAV